VLIIGIVLHNTIRNTIKLVSGLINIEQPFNTVKFHSELFQIFVIKNGYGRNACPEPNVSLSLLAFHWLSWKRSWSDSDSNSGSLSCLDLCCWLLSTVAVSYWSLVTHRRLELSTLRYAKMKYVSGHFLAHTLHLVIGGISSSISWHFAMVLTWPETCYVVDISHMRMVLLLFK